MTPPTREPEVIALLRNRPEGFNALYNADESYLCQGDDVLAAYDAIVAERDEAVQEYNCMCEQAVNAKQEANNLRARLAAAESERDAALREVERYEKGIAAALNLNEARRKLANERVMDAVRAMYEATDEVKELIAQDELYTAYQSTLDTVRE
jgi:hypothetical protein